MPRSTLHLMMLDNLRLYSRLVDCSPFLFILPCNHTRFYQDLEKAKLSKLENDDHFQELLNPNRWQQLVYQFRSENYRLHQLSSQSMFTVQGSTLKSSSSSLFGSGGASVWACLSQDTPLLQTATVPTFRPTWNHAGNIFFNAVASISPTPVSR